MKIKDIALSAAYVGQMVVKAIAVGAQEVWSAIKYIVFKDKVVEQICATNWGDGVGITEEQAAAVTDLGTVFKGNTEITSLDELEKFTSLKIIGRWGADGYRTFENCTNLKRVKFPESVEDIGYYAFSGCTSLQIESLEHVKRLERGAFNNVPFVGDVAIPNLTSIGNDESINSYQITSFSNLGFVTSIPSNFMRERTKLTYCKIPNTVKTIAGAAFLGCTNLADIGTDLSHVVTFSGQQVFQYCINLKIHLNLANLETMNLWNHFRESGVLSVRFGKIANIAAAAFYSCPNLEEVNIPSTTTNIDGSAFSSCPNLRTVILNAVTPPAIGSSTLSEGHSEMKIYVPDASVEAYKTASNWSTYTDRIEPMSKYVES